jgi:hypothetical protein
LNPVILHQTRFIFQHIVIKELKICDVNFDEWNFVNFSRIGEIHSALKEKQVKRAIGLVKGCLDLIQLRLKKPNISEDLATSSYIDTLEKLLRNMEGNSCEAEQSAMWVMNSYRENRFAWMNVEYNFDDHLYLTRFAKLIEKEKNPIRFFLRKLKGCLFR